MDKGIISEKAKWIWTSEDKREYNRFVLFRKTFDIEKFDNAYLKITADSRYEVFINSKWIGNGPIRSWVEPWYVDSYNIEEYLQPGKNVVAIQVNHYGMSINQYLLSEAGLLAEIEIDNQKIITDSSWKCAFNDAFTWPTPQLSALQPWEEQFDGRDKFYFPSDWRDVSFDDSSWNNSTEKMVAYEKPHADLKPRPIPFLTRDYKLPVKVMKTEVVKTADYLWSLNLRTCGREKTPGTTVYRSLIAHTNIYSESEQEIEVQDPHELSVWPSTVWNLNGKKILENVSRFDDQIMSWGDSRTVKVKINKGWNSLTAKLLGTSIVPRAIISIRAGKPVKFSHLKKLEAMSARPWIIAGPFSPTEEKLQELRKSMPDLEIPVDIHPDANQEALKSIWERCELTDDDLSLDYVNRIEDEQIDKENVFALCLSEKVCDEKPDIKNFEKITQNEGTTIINPAGKGDVRLMLDFGNEIVGYHEFEIEAPKGTVLDFNLFEFIQPDGRINLCEGMNNNFRYICREGWQKYRTHFRRGFRYAYMSIRDFDRPIKINNIKTIESTYPFQKRGRYECSDNKLNKIWEAGVQSVKCCSEDTYTDCPSYEQAYWVGDARNEALVDLIVNGDPRLSDRCLELAGQSLERSEIVEAMVPGVWRVLIPAWTFLWMRWISEHYQLTGDDNFAEKILEYLKNNIEGIKKHINDKGLFHLVAWNLFDWAPMDTPPDGTATHNNCTLVLALNECSDFAELIGEGEYSKKWRVLADSIKRAVNEHMWSDEKKAYYDCIHADGTPSEVFSQQTHVAAYISEVAQGQRKERARSIIEKAPEGFVKAGSPFFMFFILEVFTKEGKFEEMVKVIKEYWGKQIDAGATTFWEMYTEEADRLTRSHCHGWSAAPSFFLSSYILGVLAEEPGFEKIKLAPKIAGLRWAKGVVPIPNGDVRVSWEDKSDIWYLKVELPEKIPAEIELPLEGRVEILEGDAEVKKGVEVEAKLIMKDRKIILKIHKG